MVTIGERLHNPRLNRIPLPTFRFRQHQTVLYRQLVREHRECRQRSIQMGRKIGQPTHNRIAQWIAQLGLWGSGQTLEWSIGQQTKNRPKFSVTAKLSNAKLKYRPNGGRSAVNCLTRFNTCKTPTKRRTVTTGINGPVLDGGGFLHRASPCARTGSPKSCEGIGDFVDQFTTNAA